MFERKNISSAAYLNADKTMISAVISGVKKTVPSVAGNPDYDAIVAAVEAGKLEIGTYDVAHVPPRRVGTPREFLHLFTDTEKAAFFSAKAQSVDLELWWAVASTGDFSLEHPSVESGLAVLVQLNILSGDRADEILQSDFNAQT